jgi:hypothetical protein
MFNSIFIKTESLTQKSIQILLWKNLKRILIITMNARNSNAVEKVKKCDHNWTNACSFICLP